MNFKDCPDNIRNNEEVIEKINQKWGRNVLVMGDLNDSPYDRSILSYLHAIPISQCFLIILPD